MDRDTVAIAPEPARDAVQALRGAGRDLEDAADAAWRLASLAEQRSGAPASIEEVAAWSRRCANVLDESIERIVALDRSGLTSAGPGGPHRRHVDVRGADDADGLLSALAGAGLVPECLPLTGTASRHAAFARLPPDVLALLLRQVPHLLARTDGVPFALRDRANRRLLHAEIARLDVRRRGGEGALREDLRRLGVHEPDLGSHVTLQRQLLRVRGLSAGQLVALTGRHRELLELGSLRRQLARWRDDPELRLLGLDVTERRVVLARGDLDVASHVAVLIPGANSTLLTIGAAYEGWMDRLQEVAARRLELEGSGRGVATILWLDFAAPQGLIPAAMGPGPADEAASRLPGFLEGVAAVDRDLVTTLGHSYGSVVLGRSLARHPGKLASDQVVALGSPGMGVQAGRSLGLRDDQRLYASTLPGDPIAAVGRWNPLTGDLGRVIHGPDPRRLEGAETIALPVHDLQAADGHVRGAVQRHMQYLEPGSVALGTYADLVAGRHRYGRPTAAVEDAGRAVGASVHSRVP
jgi:hypothetical protein